MERYKGLLKIGLVGMLIAVVLITAACPQRYSISNINRDPGRFGNREVAINGTVVQSWGALGTGMYEIDDGTGRMWVISNGYGVPAKGTRIGVAGYIQPTFSLGGRSFATVMKESRRRSS
jgi:hypothetical protein